ncbi:MAG: adenylosuccinate lyase [Methylobacteriaceae bacterium]|jgi:adenylosuccinate lyase|nr:adenylosuccinate lyase [Methylobacteriaceae bacterium]
MGSTAIDSLAIGTLFGTAEMKNIFSDRNLVQKWIDTEAALAKAQGEIGMIPKEAADEINRKADATLLDYAAIGENYKSSITIVPLLKEYKKVLDNNAGEYLHWGATSQDIVDTGLILRIREAHAVIARQVADCAEAARGLAAKYRDVVMAGRTHVQHALPITFGMKAATWVYELENHEVRLKECAPRLFIGQLSGAVGTLASMNDKGLQVQKRTMDILGLGVTPVHWHSTRDHIAEFMNLLALIAGTITRITHEVLTLQRTEIGELEEPFFMGKVGSSTMPHKRNPQVCENVIGLCRLVRAQAPVAVECMNIEHERDWSCEISEWEFVPTACIHLDAALEKTLDILRNLIVYPDKMEANLNILHGIMLSESIMIHLAEKMGRLTAHDVVYKTSMYAFENKVPMLEALCGDPEVMKHFTREEVAEMLDPHSYIGIAGASVDNTLARKRP